MASPVLVVCISLISLSFRNSFKWSITAHGDIESAGCPGFTRTKSLLLISGCLLKGLGQLFESLLRLLLSLLLRSINISAHVTWELLMSWSS